MASWFACMTEFETEMEMKEERRTDGRARANVPPPPLRAQMIARAAGPGPGVGRLLKLSNEWRILESEKRTDCGSVCRVSLSLGTLWIGIVIFLVRRVVGQHRSRLRAGWNEGGREAAVERRAVAVDSRHARIPSSSVPFPSLSLCVSLALPPINCEMFFRFRASDGGRGGVHHPVGPPLCRRYILGPPPPPTKLGL